MGNKIAPKRFSLSLKERDRRWKSLRLRMRKEKIDCLVICGTATGRGDAGSAHARYTTGVGGWDEESFVVFPIDKEPTCFILTSSIDWWRSFQNWVDDVQRGFPDWAGSVARRVNELGFSNSRIGIVGLSGRVWTDGNIPHATFDKLTSKLPAAKFVDATHILEETEFVKSQEEIALHRQAARIGDEVIETMIKSSKVGTPEMVVYADMIRTAIASGAEQPVMILWNAARIPRLPPSGFPSARKIRENDLILNEISVKYNGYWAHPHQPVALGRITHLHEEMFETCAETFRKSITLLKPGTSIKRIREKITGWVEEDGFSFNGGVPLQGLGLQQYEDVGKVIVTGMVFSLQIFVVTKDWRTGINFAETFCISEHGPVQLGRRKKVEIIYV